MEHREQKFRLKLTYVSKDKSRINATEAKPINGKKEAKEIPQSVCGMKPPSVYKVRKRRLLSNHIQKNLRPQSKRIWQDSQEKKLPTEVENSGLPWSSP